MLLISLKTIIEYILKELPNEFILTTHERMDKHNQSESKISKDKLEKEYHRMHDEDGNEKDLYVRTEVISIFNRNEVSPFNPNVFSEIINSGYFNNVLKNLVTLQLSLESYKQSRDYLYYHALEDEKDHNFNIRMINRAISKYTVEIKAIKKELNI